jgi:glycolate oxidase
MDNTTIGTVEEYLHIGLPTDAAAILIIEVDGNDEESLARQVETIGQVCKTSGASEVRMAKTEAERNELWIGRRTVSPSLARRSKDKMSEDISVPRAVIPEAIRRIKEVGEKYGVLIAIFGHAGDGNLHPNLLYDKNDPDQEMRTKKAFGEIFTIAADLGGTLSGEHGVGVMKLNYIGLVESALEIELMRSIKGIFDPKNIMNPEKKFPSE